MIVYIVLMERKCLVKEKPIKQEPHRYVAGVFTNSSEAHKAGVAEEAWRSGKYKYFLHDFVMDKIHDDKIQWLNELSE